MACVLGAFAGAQDALVNWETPHVSPLDRTPDGLRLLAVNTPDNRLEVFDLSSGKPVGLAAIPVGLDPVSVRARTSTEAWVVNHVSDSVSIVDLAAGHVVATLATDDEPCDVVFAGVPERAFVSCSQVSTVLVFDPLSLATPPTRLAIRGEEPRAMAVSPGRERVYVAIFESGNGTTSLGGGTTSTVPYPPNVVDDADGPHGGASPPPNEGPNFSPAIGASLPMPPAVSLIVRRNAAGQWLDDNGGDWTAKVSGAQAADSGRPVGWTLLDHDVAIIDTATLAVSYADGLMNINMAIAVNPVTGRVTAVGTDATNEVRFLRNVKGTFVRTHIAGFTAANPGSVTVLDLNAHLDYVDPTVPQAERDKSLADPRGIAWNAAGTRAFVTGMGSNNLIALNLAGQRVGLAPTMEVGEGPTGIVVDDARGQLYVLNKFEGSLSVVSLSTQLEVARVPFFDPSPSAIKKGRRHLYDAQETSGNGVVSCASCHVDARTDRLAWDLGEPQSPMRVLDGSQQNLAAGVPSFQVLLEDWHPMKGPMLTQTLQDVIGKEPFHWRGDREGIEAFNLAFQAVMADDEQLSTAEMQELEDFLATISYPPNPFRNFDNSLPTDLPLPGHYTTGRFSPAGQPLPNGNAVNGLAAFRPPNLLQGGVLACVACHTRPTGTGTRLHRVGGSLQPFPLGPSGESRLALVPEVRVTNVTLKVPQLRNLYERTGFSATQLESTVGFGFQHDGTFDSLESFLSDPQVLVTSDQQTADLLAFLLAFSGDTDAVGSTSDLGEPLGPSGLGTHAAVGKQLTLAGPASPAESALLDSMVALASANAVGLVAKGESGGLARGWYHTGGDTFQSDRKAETISRAALEGLAAPGSELTFTVVPAVSERRIGVDRDRDSWLDRDELDWGSDPADPHSRPKLLLVPPGQRP